MLEALEGTRNVPWHRDVAGALVVIPIDGQTAVTGAGPVNADLIMLFKSGNEVVGISLGGVADAEVINDEAEDDVAGSVRP